MDELSTDMMRLTVLEIPYLKAAANILDLLVNDILPEEQGSEVSIQGSQSVSKHLGIDESHVAGDPVQPVDQALLNTIYRRIASSSISEFTLDKLPQRSQLAPKFGLNNFYNWKLSTDFGRKYPFLDSTLGMNSLPRAYSIY
jgi:hypothetical protein